MRDLAVGQQRQVRITVDEEWRLLTQYLAALENHVHFALVPSYVVGVRWLPHPHMEPEAEILRALSQFHQRVHQLDTLATVRVDHILDRHRSVFLGIFPELLTNDGSLTVGTSRGRFLPEFSVPRYLTGLAQISGLVGYRVSSETTTPQKTCYTIAARAPFIVGWYHRPGACDC